MAYGQRTGGDPGLGGHPHHAKWVEIFGLCNDGLAFVKTRLAGRGRAGGGYQAVQSAKAGGGGGEPKRLKAKDSGDRGGSSAKKEKKEKKEKAEKKEKRERGPADSAPAVAAPAVAPAAAAPVAGTSAGDGGRWVHVPT